MSPNYTPYIVMVANALPEKGAAGGLNVLMGASIDNGDLQGRYYGWNRKISDTAKPFDGHYKKGRVEFITTSYTAYDEKHFYGGCNTVLWPIHHDFYERIPERELELFLDSYKTKSKEYAARITEDLNSGHPVDLIWIQDYHFMRLAGDLKAEGVNKLIGFFLHIPVPTYAELQSLFEYQPALKTVMVETLGEIFKADQVGVHTESYKNNLIDFAEHELGAKFIDGKLVLKNGHSVRLSVVPAGINPSERFEAKELKITPRVQKVLDLIGDRDDTLRWYRRDPSKGLEQDLDAHARRLEADPSLAEREVFIAVAPPSRSNLLAYKRTSENIERKVKKINRLYSRKGLPAVILSSDVWTHDEVALKLRGLKVRPQRALTPKAKAKAPKEIKPSLAAVFASKREGLGLVGEEAVMFSDSRGRPPIVVLSERFGLAETMNAGTILADSSDRNALARAVQRAVAKTSRQARDMYHLNMKVIMRDTGEQWVKRNISEILETRIGLLPPTKHSQGTHRASVKQSFPDIRRHDSHVGVYTAAP